MVAKELLGKTKAAKYKELVQVMLSNFHALEARMSIKLYYLFNRLNKFSKNLGDLSEEEDFTEILN